MVTASGRREEQPLCMFWKLPLELRDTIYDLVYGEARQLCVKMRSAWEKSEVLRKRQQGSKFTPSTFGHSPVGHLLVSKQYFDEAIGVFFRAKRLQFEDGISVATFAESVSHLQRELASHMVMLGCKTTMTVLCALRPQYITGLTRLSDLHVIIDERIIRYGTDLDPCLEELTDTDLLHCRAVTGLMQLRGLRKLEFTRSVGSTARIPTDSTRLCRNLDRVEALIRQEAMKPRPASQKKSPYPMGIAQALALTPPVKVPDRVHPLVEEACTQRGPALADKDIPETPHEFVELFLQRPQDFLAWSLEAKKRPASASSQLAAARELALLVLAQTNC